MNGESTHKCMDELNLEDLRAEVLALRGRVAELERACLFHAGSANRLVHEVMRRAEGEQDRRGVLGVTFRESRVSE